MMPHGKRSDSPVFDAGTVAVDHRTALTIKPGGNRDSCQTGNPFKIQKRRGLFDEGADADMTKSARKHPKVSKIHWTQLAENGTSSESACCHNGRQADEHVQHNSAMLSIQRRKVKVILKDVLQTEEGQRYLRSCKCETNAKTFCTSLLKRGPREKQNENRPSTESSTARRRSSIPPKEQTKISPFRLAGSSKSTPSKMTACPEQNYMHSSKEASIPAGKRSKRFNNSPNKKELAASDEEESFSSKDRKSSSSKSHHPLLKHTDQPDSEENMFGLFEKNSKKNESQQCAEGMEESDGEIEHEDEEPLHQNGEVPDEGGRARCSVLRLSSGPTEDQFSDGEVTPISGQMAGCANENLFDSELVEVKQASKPQPSEPIVLSSEEDEEEEEEEEEDEEEEEEEEAEEEEEDGRSSQALEGAKDSHTRQKSTQPMEINMIPDTLSHPSDVNSQSPSFETLSHCSVMDLQFSAFFMGSLSALTDGLVKITDDRINISLEDSSGCKVKASLATKHVLKYSIWDGLPVQEGALEKENEEPPPSFLLLWLADVQARCIFTDLTVFQPGTHSDEGSTCVVLCLSEPMSGVQGALLASIMDIVGLKNGNKNLLSPLSHTDSLKILQNSPDAQMLQLLLRRTETNTVSYESGTTPAPESTTTTLTKDSDVQSDSRTYTLCQRRGPSTYSVSVTHKPGADWTRYRHCGPARRLIQFPPPPSKGGITVTTEDLECLDSGEFLNDVIIDFYLKYLFVEKAPDASVRRSHVFSSFFYKQLTRRDNANEDSTSTPTQHRRHQRVKTWTRHVDIFDKDFLFVPVNQEAHWYLVVVCFPGLDVPQYVERGSSSSVQDGTEDTSDVTAQCESQNGDGDINSNQNSARSTSASGPPTCTEHTCNQQTVCKRPCILIMDSLKLSVHERVFKLLREYLQVEWEVKRGGHREFNAERMVGSHCKVPLQDNSSDCGLYLLQYAESFLQDPVVHFDLPLKLDCWFPRQKVREKREEIRDLILHLYRFQQGSLGNDGSDDGKEIRDIAL